MNDSNKISKENMIEAIKRSGYLLESEISNFLARADFFVESNQIIEDPITGKSREIDLIAEYYDRSSNQRSEHKVCAKIKFVFEIKNNIYPLVLLTKFEFSPDIEIWESTKEIQTAPEGINWGSTDSFYDKLFSNNESIYTQYCSFDFKKNNKEIIANHPEQVYTGLSKITQYCEECVESWSDTEDRDEEHKYCNKYYRKFLFLPVLLINDDLYEMKVEANKEPLLHKVDCSRLIFNYHHNSLPKIATIWVVTKPGFQNFMKEMIKIQRSLELEMVEVKKKLKKA